MITTSHSIEVSKTTLFDCRKFLYFDTLIVGALCGFFAIISRLYLCSLLVFIILGVQRPGYLKILRTPYKFEFKNEYVIFYYRFLRKNRMKMIPYENFTFVKEQWHQKDTRGYSVSYLDNRKKNFYSFFMPTLTKMKHWDEEALDYLLSLAEQNGVTIKNWDYPIRWGR